jgi:hypothetical protein
MPSYRTVISRQQLYQLEHYLFRLGEYVDTPEFKEKNSQQQLNILKELGFMEIAISILRQTFHGGNQEIPVVGWQIDNPNEAEGYFKVHYFSCMRVAADCAGTTTSRVSAVCNGKRKSTAGWNFKLRSEYEDGEPVTWDLDGPSFEIVEY